MNDMLKRGFFLGLGAAAYGKEKIQTYIDDLVTKGRITPREAEQWKEDLIERGKHAESEWNGRTKDKAKESLKEMGLAVDSDVERLESKLQQLEEQIENLKKSSSNDTNG
ncbi:phasin family protein [Salibacterium sp. K-3]